jgi:hypothetical protein
VREGLNGNPADMNNRRELDPSRTSNVTCLTTIECSLYDEEMRVDAVSGQKVEPIRRVREVSANDVQINFHKGLIVHHAEVHHGQRGTNEYIFWDGFVHRLL